MKKPSVLSKPKINWWWVLVFSATIHTFDSIQTTWQIAIIVLLSFIGFAFSNLAAEQYEDNLQA